ncbi:MAG: TIGR03960 family B12-binding radical SAM protein [Proteobacteria bacterium]|nr:TIGR03960 family B12-binding radical SAM protein [Pseudomonadota bacterium]MBU1714291.1 TIGR03960 family B12-binding radical SAM protein [Pseudomonadota bacterium]
MTIEELISRVKKPSRYCGNEFNVTKKVWDQVSLRIALIFPDLYEIGMSHQGLQILYHIINNQANLLAERAYAPDLDMEALLRSRGEELFSLESHRPLKEFDLLGITLPYELCYSNILTVLDLAGIPFRSVDRDQSYPLIIGGGPGAFHPEPVADFFDAILLGDGEEAIIEIAQIVMRAKEQAVDRRETLQRLAALPGIYIPSLFEPVYDEEGVFQDIKPLQADYSKVRRRVLPDIEDGGGEPPLVPLARVVHDRLGIEIARGCTRGCRFCQAGVIYRPVRERSMERVIELARKGIAEGGFDELALLSLSTGDYSCIAPLLGRLMDEFSKANVSVSMPSMRVGTLTPEIMSQIKRVRKTGFTLAPEAGTDRLRRVINKGITEDDLLSSSKAAFELGWKLLKFYFMFGLPTETEDDLAAIPELVKKARQTGKGGGHKINVSVGTFVPKPHTPFQREPQLSIGEGFTRINFLKERLRGNGFQLKWNDPRQSFLEGVLSRGDRKLAQVIEAAWRLGARLDAWSDYYKLDTWRQAADECGIDLEYYLRRRLPEENLPWQHLDAGLDDEFFKQEYEKALNEIYTPDCRVHGCQKCGLCDFKTVKPIVNSCPQFEPTAEKEIASAEKKVTAAIHFVYRFDYAKLNEARFLGHLEVIQMFFRVFRRLDLPINYSQGFSPSPKVSFSPALPLGTESMAEYFVVDLFEPLQDINGMLTAINRLLPGGFEIIGIAYDGSDLGQKGQACYRITLGKEYQQGDLEKFMAAATFDIRLSRKGKERKIDGRSMVTDLRMSEDKKIDLVLNSEVGQAGIKPMELLAAVLGLSDEDVLDSRVIKLWYREDDGK